MTIHPYKDHIPAIAPDVFIAPGAQIVGRVAIGSRSSIWYNCVVRGDVDYISIGERSNLQDGSVVHVTRDTNPTIIGNDCLIGHMVLLHGCRLEDHSFVGMSATVMDQCVIESDGMLGAGSILTPGKRIAAGQLWVGRPAKYLRALTAEEIATNRALVVSYVELAQEHIASLGASR